VRKKEGRKVTLTSLVDMNREKEKGIEKEGEFREQN